MLHRITKIHACFRREVLGFPPGTRLRVTDSLKELLRMTTIPLRTPDGDIVEIPMSAINFTVVHTNIALPLPGSPSAVS